MPILNYTTGVDVWKTISEIQKSMSKAAVSHINVQNDAKGFPIGMSFTVFLNDKPLNFALPANYLGILRSLNKSKGVPGKYKTNEQALRIAWRILLNWIEAQLAIVEAELAPIEDVFLPYLVIHASGQTLSDHLLRGNGLKQLENKK